MPASSLYGSRSMTSIASGRGSRATVTHSLPGTTGKVQPKWWQRRPILHTAFLTDLQKGSYWAAIFTLVQSILQVILALFDTYCLIEARPGSRHFRSFGISFLFVYAGNEHIRRTLIAMSVLLFSSAVYLMVTSIILMAALKKEHEVKFKHWLRAMGLFIVIRTISILFSSIVNDLYFAYHQAMLIIWFFLTGFNVFAFLIVVSNFQELSNITRLEDMAKLKMSTLSSLNASRSLSHHSLDSYNKYGTVNIQPSPQVSIRMGHATSVSRPGSTTGSLSSFNMGGTVGYGTVGSSSVAPRGLPGSSHPPSTASSIPLSSFGLNFNPAGVFTIEQLTGSTASLNRGQTPTQGFK